jgi:DNA-binding PucR family transcriptional regulator
MTLDTHLANGRSATATAATLSVHRNTVLYRLRRIGEITDLDLEDADVRFLVQFAMRAYHRFGVENTLV